MSDTPFPEIAHDIASILNLDAPQFNAWPTPWTYRFHVIEPELGARVVVLEGEQEEIAKVKSSHLADRIVQWTRLQSNPELLLTKGKAKEAADVWQSISTPIPMGEIKAVRWKSDPGYTWRRLPWDEGEGPTPTWDKILGKMTNSEAFCQFIGSLLYDDAKQHQYVWAHGLGGDGKGSINRFLKAVFGPSYRSKQPPAPNDKFWAHGLLGARLVVFPDCNSQGFTAGGLFKTLSGGDPVDVEAKNEMSFTVELCAKFMFLSNERPLLSCEEADMRRIIFCEFVEKTKKEDKDPAFQAKLWAEGGYFLSKCARKYITACPNHEDIKSDDQGIRAWLSTNEEKFQTVFDEHFMQPSDAHRDGKGLRGLDAERIRLLSLEPKHLLAITQAAFKEPHTQKAFRDWLYKKYGVLKTHFKDDQGSVFYRYVGIHTIPTKYVTEAVERKLRLLRNTM